MNNKCCSYRSCQCRTEPCHCCIGSTGPAGPQGPTGPTGLQGATGPTGSSLSPAYGTFYNNEGLMFADGSLALSTFLAVPPAGLSHIPGDSFVLVIDPGVYNVAYGVNNSGSTPFALRINGIIVPGSIINPLSGGFVSGWATLALAADDTIAIVLTESTETVINRVIMNFVKVN